MTYTVFNLRAARWEIDLVEIRGNHGG